MKTSRILVVDDEPHIRRLIELTLRKAGFDNLVFAQNGREVLTITQETPVDLVIMDFLMPGLDGLCALELLHRRPSAERLPVIMISGNAELHAVHDLTSIGAAAVLGKPCSPSHLLATVERVLMENQTPVLAV